MVGARQSLPLQCDKDLPSKSNAKLSLDFLLDDSCQEKIISLDLVPVEMNIFRFYQEVERPLPQSHHAHYNYDIQKICTLFILLVCFFFLQSFVSL